jgi:hypothetical protein
MPASLTRFVSKSLPNVLKVSAFIFDCGHWNAQADPLSSCGNHIQIRIFIYESARY